MQWPLIDKGLMTALGLGLVGALLGGVGDRLLGNPNKKHSQDGGGGLLPSYETRQDFTVPIAQGNQGIFETLYWMAVIVRRDIHDQKVRDKALEIVGNTRGHDFGREIESLFRYVKDRITYRRDPVDQERVQDSRRTLFEFQSGDCDDKVVALASMLGSIGAKSRFVVCGYTSDNFHHVYLEVFHDGQWMPLDPTNERASVGWEAGLPFRCAYEIWG